MAKKAGSVKELPVMADEDVQSEEELQAADLADPNPIQEQPTADQQAKPTEGADKPHEQAVPYDRFKEVNDRLKAAEDRERERERQTAEWREKWARNDERIRTEQSLADNARRAAEAARQQAERPDPAIDPQGARIYDMAQELAQLKQQNGQFMQQFQGTQQQIQQNEFQNRVAQFENMDVQRAMAMHPDYMPALTYLRNKRIELNQALGYSPEQAAAFWEAEKNAYVVQAMQNGASATEFAYKMATALGYQTPAAANGTNGHANGSAAPASNQRMTQLQNGQKVTGLGGKIPAPAQDNLANLRFATQTQLQEHLASFADEEAWLARMNADPAYRDLMNELFKKADLGELPR